MAKLRWGRSEVDVVPGSKLRWGRSEASVNAPVTGSKLRWGRSEAVGAIAVSLLPFANQVGLDALTTVTLTATLAAGSATPDTYTWTRQSGAAVTITGTGSSVTLLAPAGLVTDFGATVTIRCTPRLGGVDQPYREVTITTLPHQYWRATTSGWVPEYAPLSL